MLPTYNTEKMNIERKATEHEVEVLKFLNELRDSGATNMFGAAPYITDMFGDDRTEARRLLSLWMNNFNKEADYEFISD